MKILGLDFGDKTIGVAVSDSLLLTASPVTVLRRKENEGLKKSIEALAELIKTHNIERIIVGYPKNMDNSVGERASKTAKFAKRLEKEFGTVVTLWDERLSSVSAERMMLEADLSRKKRKESIDKAAAAMILQNYLDYERNNKKKGDNFMADNNDNVLNGDESEEFDVIILTDDESGEDVELVIVDSAEADGCTYLLVVETDDVEDEVEGEEVAASIVKEFKDENGEFVYEIVEEDAEFEKAAALFADSNDFEIL